LVSAADYLVSLKDGYGISDDIKSREEFEKAFRDFMKKDEIVIGKKTKTSEKEVNIRPMIHLTAFCDEEYKEKLSLLLNADEQTSDESEIQNNQESGKGDIQNNQCLENSVAEVYENGIRVFIQTSTGSSANLKPELVMEAFYEELGIPFNQYDWQVHRLETYTRDAESQKLMALNRISR
jgi:hypothetical protein